MAFALAAAALCSIALASGAAPTWSLVALMGMMGFGVGFSGPSRDILVRRAATSTFGSGAYGRIYGFVYSGIDTGLAIAPLVFGVLMDAGPLHRRCYGAWPCCRSSPSSPRSRWVSVRAPERRVRRMKGSSTKR